MCLRQDPDVILVGEMRDPETICRRHHDCGDRAPGVFLASHQRRRLHASTAFWIRFASDRQRSSPEPVVVDSSGHSSAKHFWLNASGVGRVLACEFLMVTPAVRNLIREQKLEQIFLAMQTGSRLGMQTMNQSLLTLVTKQKITSEEAMTVSPDVEELKRMLPKGFTGQM
jgi:twitching motility protein PilT